MVDITGAESAVRRDLLSDHENRTERFDGLDRFGLARKSAVLRQQNARAEHGNADRDFVAGMIPHHQGAIDMAVDLNCNMVRCWGGGVYESEAFFEFFFG